MELITLPPEVITYITYFITIKDIYRLRQCNMLLYNIIDLDKIIKNRTAFISELISISGRHREYYKLENTIHGLLTVFNNNDTIYETHNYVNGNIHGKSIQYYQYPDQVCYTFTYYKGTKQGPAIVYHQTGIPKIISNYFKGELHGTLIGYYNNNNMEIRCEYVNGKTHGERCEYYINGNPKSLYTYVNNVKHGPYIIWSKFGNILYSGICNYNIKK